MRLMFGVIACATACLDLPGHRCQPALGAAQCGDHGVCEPEQACSFPSSACPSGRAFGSEAGGGLANQCVVRDPCSGAATATVSLPAIANAATKGSVPDAVIATSESIRVDPNDNITCLGSGQPERGLLRFDLTSLEGGTITNATLGLTSDENLSGSMAFAPILEEWIEGEVTWNSRARDHRWQTIGPRDPSSVGAAWVHATIPSGRVQISLSTQPQIWIDDPASNHGLVMWVENTPCDGINISSRTATAIDARPLLRVELSCR
jgi:hypothetical protein